MHGEMTDKSPGAAYNRVRLIIEIYGILFAILCCHGQKSHFPEVNSFWVISFLLFKG